MGKQKCEHCNSLQGNDSFSCGLIYGLSDSICIISTASLIAFNFQLPLTMRSICMFFGWWNWWNHRPAQLSKILRLLFGENCIHRGLRDL